ncbi:MAG: hypothetical protein U0797_21695 [Gemmataceae bacterium]
MKIDGKALLFRPATPWPTRRRLLFLRRGNSLHLLETALVVEGYRQRLFIPVVDAFFRKALSEWTTVTIPYSRILDFRHRPMFWGRVVAALVLWLPVVALLANGLFDARHSETGRAEVVTTAIALGVGAAVLTPLLLLWALEPRNQLLFRQADGKRALIVFSIRRKKLQEAFVRQLEANREVSRGRVAEVVESEDATSPMPFVLLLLFLLGHDLVPGLIQGLRPGNDVWIALGEAALNALAVATLALLFVGPRSLAPRWIAVGVIPRS